VPVTLVPLVALPFLKVSPLSVRVPVVAEQLSNLKFGVPAAELRSIVTPVPPSIVMFAWLNEISPLVSVTVVTPSKTMVSPLLAEASAARKEPSPLSAPLETVIVLAAFVV